MRLQKRNKDTNLNYPTHNSLTELIVLFNLPALYMNMQYGVIFSCIFSFWNFVCLIINIQRNKSQIKSLLTYSGYTQLIYKLYKQITLLH